MEGMFQGGRGAGTGWAREMGLFGVSLFFRKSGACLFHAWAWVYSFCTSCLRNSLIPFPKDALRERGLSCGQEFSTLRGSGHLMSRGTLSCWV